MSPRSVPLTVIFPMGQPQENLSPGRWDDAQRGATPTWRHTARGPVNDMPLVTTVWSQSPAPLALPQTEDPKHRSVRSAVGRPVPPGTPPWVIPAQRALTHRGPTPPSLSFFICKTGIRGDSHEGSLKTGDN